MAGDKFLKLASRETKQYNVNRDMEIQLFVDNLIFCQYMQTFSFSIYLYVYMLAKIT